MFIIDRLRSIAASKSSTIAINFGNINMTYEELIQRVDSLAFELHCRGIGPGDCVAIALPRSFELIVAIFGVLASGAIYVPLDLTNPKSRLLTMLKDCNSVLLLSNDEGKDLSILTGINLLHPKDWPLHGHGLKSEDGTTAYIIYTSGSTGNPKGVEVSHQALENYLNWAISELPFTGGGVPLFTSISFDHAITNIFPPLLMGDKIILSPAIEGGRSLASALLLNRHLRNEQYSYMKIIPSLFEFLNKEQRAQLGLYTNLLLFGGEKLSSALVRDARLYNPDLPIINHYGPTEATAACCVYKVPHEISGSSIPIGKPIPGVEISIRRADFTIANHGETGELFIAGKALANGYWQSPDITSKAFINYSDNIYSKKLWYRTGDLARLRSDGNIEYLGRLDEQIKILGNRIEPAEIIESLNTYPGIKQSAVFTVENDKPKELVAALTFFYERADIRDIQKHLQALLPPTMIPSRFLLLDEMPLTASGKLDIKKLKLMLSKKHNNSSIEDSVLRKFNEVLCQENIGLEDDFFLLGGDSLGTVEIITWAAKEFNIPIEISCLFDFPTVTLLSEHIRELIHAC